MNKMILIKLLLLIFISGCQVQTNTEPKTLYNENFKWTITIPENFVNVSPKDWAKVQNTGIDAVEATYGEEVVNQAEIIFVFKNADFNYLESNYQPFDIKVDGDYIESCKNVNEILYETFRAQIPNAKLDSVSSAEKISNLDFQTFKIKIDFQNGIIMHAKMYSRLFDKKEFSVNIMYVDEKLGKKMIDAWTNSKFE